MFAEMCHLRVLILTGLFSHSRVLILIGARGFSHSRVLTLIGWFSDRCYFIVHVIVMCTLPLLVCFALHVVFKYDQFTILVSLLHILVQYLHSNSNSNSIFIAPNLYPKTGSRCTKQKQKTVIINLRHSKGQRHREK